MEGIRVAQLIFERVLPPPPELIHEIVTLEVVKVNELDETAGGVVGSEGLVLASHRLPLFFKPYISILPLLIPLPSLIIPLCRLHRIAVW